MSDAEQFGMVPVEDDDLRLQTADGEIIEKVTTLGTLGVPPSEGTLQDHVGKRILVHEFTLFHSEEYDAEGLRILARVALPDGTVSKLGYVATVSEIVVRQVKQAYPAWTEGTLELETPLWAMVVAVGRALELR